MECIIEINQDQFLEEVIEKSKTTPVVVDFWAPWCNPCKQLTPILENIINKKNNKVILAKINIDENQGIAAQLNIKSIPTVYGFLDGRPVDAFQGVQSESKIEAMIDKLIENAPGNEVPKLLEEADQLFKELKYEEAAKIYENLVSLDPGNSKIISGLLRCLVQLKKFVDVQEFINSLDETILADPEIKKINKFLENLDLKNDCLSLKDIENKLNADPSNKNLRFELSLKLLQSNEIEKGFDELLLIFNDDPKWNEEAAKKKLLEYFDMLGFNDPNVINARKKLSSLMFK